MLKRLVDIEQHIFARGKIVKDESVCDGVVTISGKGFKCRAVCARGSVYYLFPSGASFKSGNYSSALRDKFGEEFPYGWVHDDNVEGFTPETSTTKTPTGTARVFKFRKFYTVTVEDAMTAPGFRNTSRDTYLKWRENGREYTRLRWKLFGNYTGEKIRNVRAELKDATKTRPTFTVRYQRGQIKIEDTDYSLKNALTEVKKAIRRYRISSRHSGEDAMTAGRFLLRFLERQAELAVHPKKPKTSEQYVGVELEMAAPKYGKELAAKIPKELWPYIHIKSDGSVDGEPGAEHAVEISVLATRAEIHGVIEKLTDALKAAGCKVNNSCGLHIHLDARDIAFDQTGHFTPEIKRRYYNMVKTSKALRGILPDHRLSSTYCRENATTEINTRNRYHAINGCALLKYKTTEIRSFAGTLDAKKINFWIKLWSHVYDMPDTILRAPSEIGAFLDRIKVTPDVKGYALARAEFIRTQNPSSENLIPA